ncbi:hypothetical protein L208DRAFT_1367561 [Tricholoma matsutake]|nr:hypothetical protein L208DRAFT_1367561 [Tricholoma matsutake 945]
MANIERGLSVSPQLSQKEGPELLEGILDPSWDGSGPLKEDSHDTSTREGPDVSVKCPPPAPADAKSTSNLSRPSLVQLGSNGSSTSHPKRFSAVNINKKFLEKNSSAVGSLPTSQGSVNAKSGGPVSRPQVQPPSSHSRLVTTKLTAVSPASSTSGAGWSRPSSAAPPPTTGSHSPNGDSPLLPTASTASTTATPGTTSLPHAKLIQPQPRAALPQTGSSSKSATGGASTKPVWRNLKLSQAAPQRPEVRQNDFPTAAEVAQGTTSLRMAKASDVAEAALIAAANKQARIEEADTFRGVHLDPNAHHWDEMEEDDDNFLGGVIEFGDGRQYKVEPSSRPSESPPVSDLVSLPHGNHIARSRVDEAALLKDPSSEVPVSKEERFADDFDRSWPRSRTSPAPSTRALTPSSGQLPASAKAGSTAPISPITLHSPLETSRVLFNERSNRLEPYSNTRTGPHPSRRGSHHESSTSPIELKSARDFPPVSPLHSNIQLLQKHGNADFPNRSRRFSGGNSGAIGSGYSGSYQRDRELPRDEPPHSPRLSKNNRDPSEIRGQDRDNGERGRRSVMGPPALPHAPRRPSKDGGRQFPPHLADISPSAVAPQGRLSSMDSKFPSGGSAPPRPQSQSPALSHASAVLVSPGLASTSLPQLSAPELDEVRKDVMQSAAARAKQRRQHEEEEREKEKDRARRKAAEIEQRMKVADAEKAKLDEVEKPAQLEDDQVVAVIEEAVKSVNLSKDTAPQSQRLQSGPRTPPLKAVSIQSPNTPHSPTSQRISTSVSSVAATPVSATTMPVAQAESWRSKAAPPYPLPIEVPPKVSIPIFPPPPPSALEQVESLASNPEEELEVVDFSDMDKFVGATDFPPSPMAKPEPVSTQSSRPVASDFFNDTPDAHDPANTNIVTWRQRLSQDALDPLRSSEAISTSTDCHVQAVTVSSHVATQRTPRSQTFYKEAAMSALDDVMSRIKGALDGMQASEATKEVLILSPESDSSTIKSSVPRSLGRSSSQRDRWIPPRLRLQSYDQELHEEPVTGFEPPRSPKPAWNAFVVRLPKSARALEPISRKQLQIFSKPVYQVRWDIFSFDPPVGGMNRRDSALNDILFGKPPRGYRGNPKYRVMLPRLEPRVNIPSHSFSQKSNGVGAFGRPGGADGVTTWRKPASAKPHSSDATKSEPVLSTISRSPPPDTLSTDPDVTSVSISSSSDSSKADALAAPTRSRLQPKMPAGSAVAFYRDSRIDAVEADLKPSVNFIVTSELEEVRQTTPVKNKPSITVTSPLTVRASNDDSVRSVKPLINGINSSPPAENGAPSLIPNKPESKVSEDSTDRVPITPPSQHNSPWTRTALSMPLKESPARGPDPEHLKAVWSQTSNKSGFHSVNSLEGIADDLTALPFTLQEVKSEDGETPPPSVSAAPSRMSLHDVTKAFQQVPSSSSSSSTSHRTPPITAPPTTRPPNYAYTLPPPPPNGMRPYGAYPSQMLSHSPSPGVMYPHPMASSPVPNRMPVNGHTPVYNPPMWMSMPGPSPQNHGNMMRAMTSPYPAQLMPYPSPGTPAMYASQSSPGMQNTAQQQTVGQAGRDRGMSLMSPVMPPAAPAMYGSPVLMHAPVMSVPQNHGYMPVQGSGRGQVRADSGHLPVQQHSQHSNYMPPQSSFNPVASASFARSPW